MYWPLNGDNMSKQDQGDVARQFWRSSKRGQIGPEQLYERQREHLQQDILPLLEGDARLLDIGCADGEFSLLFAQKVAHVLAFDIGEELVGQARERAEQLGIGNIEFRVADIFEFQTDERFDAVSLMGVLTCISDDNAAARVLLKATSLLKPGGLLILKDSVLLHGQEPRYLLTEHYEAKYRPEARYLALIRSMGLHEVANYPLLAMDNCEQTSVLYLFRPVLAQQPSLPIRGLRVACYGSMPFHFRSLRPLAECFEDSLLSLSIEEVMAWRPQVIAVADGWSVEFWRDYCDAHQVLLIGMRHGSVTRYGFAEPQYNHADYLCGSVWDIEDTLLSDVHPRLGFLLTGNSWVDQVFRLPPRADFGAQPTILFAPTYNPEISAAVYFGERVVSLIRSIYPQARIIIKPHPAIVQHEHGFVVDKGLFRELMAVWRAQAAEDPLLQLVDDPEASIADSFAEADILVADRSSLLFEYMVLDRPILLYSSDARVEHWDYNPQAPGNAWRDIGMEFSDDSSFLALLRDVRRNHQELCREPQARRTQQLYGDFRDGCSVQRVAAAIAQVPRPHVLINSCDGGRSAALLEAFDDRLAFKRISLIGTPVNSEQLYDVRQYEDFSKWRLAQSDRELDQAVLLVDGRSSYQPGSANQLCHGLALLARGDADAQLLSQRSHDEPALTGVTAEEWIRERQNWALDALQGEPVWQLLPAHRLRRALRVLPVSLSDGVVTTWWKTLCAQGQTVHWRSERLDVVMDASVVRVVGRGHYLAGPNARLQLVPAVQGWPRHQAAVHLQICAVDGADYDRFPFKADIRLNGVRWREITFSSFRPQWIALPFHPNEAGVVEVELHSSAMFPGMTGLAGPLSVALAFADEAPEEASSDSHSSTQLLEQWLAARQLTPVQQRLVVERLGQYAGGPALGVVILDPEGDAGLVATTLRSLFREDSLYQVQKVVVLSSADAATTAADARLHFLQIESDHYAEAINTLVEQGGYDWFMLARAGDQFTQHGLLMAALALLEAPGCRAIYADALQQMGDSSLGAVLRPDFNLDMLLSFPAAMARHWLYRREDFLAIGGFDPGYGGALEFDLLLRLIEHGGMAGLGHIDEPLVVAEAPRLQDNECERATLLRHLALRGYQASLKPHMPGRYRIDYGHSAQPLVSIIIPTKDQLPILQRCVESLLEKTRYPNYEVLIVDNDSQTSEAQAWLAGVESWGESLVRVLRYPYPFNYSAINNMAVQAAHGEYLVLLNNDTAILREDWLDAMLNHAQRPEVGVVGAKLLYPDGRIQHAGVVLGLRGPADHPFIGEAMDAPGYMQRLQVDQNYSAVTAACLMIRKSLYEEVGGLDEEAFKVSYNDVDLCLKTREAGYLTVWTPHAVVMHEGSVSQTKVDPAAQEAKRKRFVAEQDAMYAKWLPLIAADPAYNRNLSLSGAGFALEADSQLIWRPLDSWRPLPVVLAHPADPWGCGNYRVIKPFEAMRDAGLIDGMLSDGLLQVADLARYDPDVLVLQRQLGDERLEAMRRIKTLSRAFKVYELDDYLPNLPMKSLHREHMPRDVLKSLRKGLGFVDRFVVSTEALADAFSGLHADIRVIENRLPREWWQNLTSQRRRGRKPRVGWAGGVSHTGDLELIADVVKELAGEVEWVFMGMCPDRIRPYVQEVHAGVDINAYPAALASLDLDLALAPVEQNLFNECKSNLRLLEYGACGFPVVCSDLRCYEGELPVTRVKNRFKDWVDAIRMHVNDLDASARQGDALRTAVMRDWMLEGGNLELWRRAWLPD